MPVIPLIAAPHEPIASSYSVNTLCTAAVRCTQGVSFLCSRGLGVSSVVVGNLDDDTVVDRACVVKREVGVVSLTSQRHSIDMFVSCKSLFACQC